MKVWEKSRRIGASWCEASDAALYGAGESGGDTWYIGYNKEMAEEFIGDKRHGDAGIALPLAHCASRQEAVVYDYHRVAPREDDRPGWDDPRPRDVRVNAGFGLRRGTW